MELRKDPITRSWVMTGDDPDIISPERSFCRFCPDAPESPQVISTIPSTDGSGPWAARAVVHPSALYHIEGDPQRRGDGLYDRMQTVGAHELLIENPRHDRPLWQASDAEIEKYIVLMAQRMQDLRRDGRFKYITVYKNQGPFAGQEFTHPISELTATTFVPRRVLYELRAARDYFQQKERCVFCDILSQELRAGIRLVETYGDYIALCPYAARTPYETWILPRTHDAGFARSILRRSDNHELAAILRRTLNRIRSLGQDFHFVLHTMPNTQHRAASLGYWTTIDDDYHWHLEILPVLGPKIKSYTFKEVYFSPVTSETAAARLRSASPGE
jgi:UDPglucose--hexose-1-phosphate uridylyltransferase